jgi:hypothetical protein
MNCSQNPGNINLQDNPLDVLWNAAPADCRPKKSAAVRAAL